MKLTLSGVSCLHSWARVAGGRRCRCIQGRCSGTGGGSDSQVRGSISWGFLAGPGELVEFAAYRDERVDHGDGEHGPAVQRAFVADDGFLCCLEEFLRVAEVLGARAR